jgi:hypothetical protein
LNTKRRSLHRSRQKSPICSIQPVEDIVDENEKDEVVEIVEDEVDEDEGHEIATSGSMDSSTDAVSLEHEGENQSKAQEAPPSPTGVMHPMSA